jgi:transposase-like protein
MSKKQKTEKEKIAIIEEAKSQGAIETARKYGIGFSTLMRWKQQFALGGNVHIKTVSSLSESEIKKVLLENRRLKEIVADKELQIKIQLELLKKNF